MKNQLVRSLSVITVILSLGESKKYLLETDGQPKGGADGDDYTNQFIFYEWMAEVPCEERKGDAMCPEYMVCEIQKCTEKPYEPEPWATKVPCKERVGNLTCPEFAKICKKGYCLNENEEKDPWMARDIPCAERTEEFACPEHTSCKIDNCQPNLDDYVASGQPKKYLVETEDEVEKDSPQEINGFLPDRR